MPQARTGDTGLDEDRPWTQSLPDAVAAFVALAARTRAAGRSPSASGPARLCRSRRVTCACCSGASRRGARTSREPYVEALEARGIPHLLVGGQSFHQREEVESLRTALTAIEWPDDELAVYATLQGPAVRRRRRGAARVPAARRGGCTRFACRRRNDGRPRRIWRPWSDALALLRSTAPPAQLRARSRRRCAALLTATRAHAAFVLRPSGEQALANVLRVAELARDVRGGGRHLVPRLRRAARARRPRARRRRRPSWRRRSEGVRIMTVHRAKGLEFPVVILADITRQRVGAATRAATSTPSAGSARCAWRAGRRGICSSTRSDELARDRAEGVRVAYVAATRARDLLVVPAVGDDPFAGGWEAASDGWIAPVQRAVVSAEPSAGARRDARRRDARRSARTACSSGRTATRRGATTCSPGLHAFGEGDAGYGVVWWDPRRARRSTCSRVYGLRREDLIQDPGRDDRGGGPARDTTSGSTTRRPRRSAARSRAFAVRTVTDWARARAGDRATTARRSPARSIVVVTPRPLARPCGPRFGTLVHATLATVAARRDRDADRRGRALCRRASSARRRTRSRRRRRSSRRALAHPLMARAREAWRQGRCRRETPISAVAPDGAHWSKACWISRSRTAGGWTVVDFKTDAEIAGRAREVPAPGRALRVDRGARHRPAGHGGAAAAVSGAERASVSRSRSAPRASTLPGAHAPAATRMRSPQQASLCRPVGHGRI